MKKLKFLNVCYDTKTLNTEFANYISSHIDNFLEYEDHDELIEIIDKNDVHFVITKYNFELLKQIRVLNKQIQIIAVLDELNHTHLLESLEIKHLKFIQSLDSMNDFIDALKDCVKNIDSNKSNIINLKNGFVYDYYNKSLFKDNTIISLTKKELLFLDFLIKNHDSSMSYEEINSNIWNGFMTNDSLRSLVKELRKKTYKELIKNVSGIGYRIDTTQ
ncbi:MAG: helix-turn-helix domain-containing protein [Aliarcobacter sp.]|nr:helix-turn-helix domain-containing protein [Aliarcobacter sp.]